MATGKRYPPVYLRHFLPAYFYPRNANYITRPPDHIEENPDDPYYPDAIEKYFARPRVYENYTYFEYFKYCQISKNRMTKKDGFRDGIQDQLGYEKGQLQFTVRLKSRRCPMRPGQSCVHTYDNAVNFENGEKLGGTELSGIFKHRSNFSSKVICNVGAKVMFSSLTACWQTKVLSTDLLV